MKHLLRALLYACILLLVPFARAAPPQTINYQGYLTNPGGTPVNTSVVMTFRLYNAASGGSPLFAETQLSVGVANGNFNAVIGSVSPIALAFDVPYWLTVAINSDPEMSPRQPLASSPYAFRASTLDSSATIDGAQVTGSVASAGSANIATMAMLAGGLQGSLPGSQVSGVLTTASIPAAQITGTLAGSQLTAIQRLPTSACALNQIPQWNGSAWVCAAASSGSNGNITGNLMMVNSTATEGNIIKGGALFMHNTGFESAYLGANAGNLTTTGGSNTGVGVSALGLIQGGILNSAFGNAVLYRNTVGAFNTGVGGGALVQNIDGSSNTAIGANALQSATASENIAIGSSAGANITVGGKNILIGNPGDPMDANTVRLGMAGNQTRTFVAGVSGVTPALGTLPVVIDSNGQLGTGAAVASGVTNIATGAGLAGGPITSTGTITLASTQLLPVAACAANQIAKWNGSAWACATDVDTNSGGTVTSIAAGGGLTGGIITGAGTIEIDPTSNVLKNNFYVIGGNFFGLGTTAQIGSTTNVPVEIIANGTRALRIEPNGSSANITLGHPTNVAGGIGIVGATVSGGGQGGTPNVATSFFATVAGGERNTASGDRSVVSGGYFNVASGARSAVSGGEENNASGVRATISGGYLNTAVGSNATVGGGTQNDAGGFAAAVLGGLNNNAVIGNYQAMGGGRNNTASNDDATVAGGTGNTASGPASSVGGGTGNIASGSTATVGGGYFNNATATSSTVAGGIFNTASGDNATVAGGMNNTALGFYSFAAGQQAKANSFGCFTWADNSATDFACNTGNAFMARATGGVQFRTSLNLSTGCNIAAGGSGWTCTSSRETKKDFTAMDVVDVLKRVAGMPVTQWRYRTETSGARHVGPMAEDFHAAFGLGEDNRAINSIDASGVALAAIQGLNQLLGKKDAEIETQGKRIRMLEDALAAIQSRLGMR